MKSKIIVVKNIKIKFILFISIIFFVIFSIILANNDKMSEDKILNLNNIENKQPIIETKEVTKYEEKKIKRTLPKEINGYEIIAKIEIPKIELETYILGETNKDTLNESVTKLCGPKVNEVGNFCILGHNYNSTKMFKKIKNLEIGDNILVSDVYNQTIEYIVYDKYKIYPKETKCLSQETDNEREITLITCTTGGIKRLVIKAKEIYD